MLTALRELRMIEKKKGESLPQDITGRLQLMLTIAASNPLAFCFNLFREGRASVSGTALVEVATAYVGPEEGKMENGYKEHTVCAQMTDTGHYYIVSTAHAFKDSICDWTGNVSHCCMLHCKFLEGPIFFPVLKSACSWLREQWERYSRCVQAGE